MDKKVCSKCNQTLPIDNFYFKNKSKGYRKSYCKECGKKYYKANKERKNAYDKAYREANKEKLAEQKKAYWEANKEKLAEQKKAYYEANKEKFIKWRKANKEKVSEREKIYREANREKRNAYKKQRKKSDPLFRLSINYRSSCRRAFLSIGQKKNTKSLKLLGFKTWQELAEHLEPQFYDHPKTGEKMTFDNHGLYGWHIDHIIPLSTAKTEEDVIKLSHYTNLQPLWAEENLSKSNKILDTQ
jgi:hypothetical protein